MIHEEICTYEVCKLAKEKEGHRYKRGDKHPTEELYFWQYHHPYYKETNGEVWLPKEEYERKVLAHSESTRIYKKNHPIMIATSSAIQRDRAKYHTPKDQLVDVKFIEELLVKQDGKCYWYNIKMDVDSIEGSRNPLKVTIDRLDCNKGYSKDNVVLASYAANCGRGDCPKELWENIIKIIGNGIISSKENIK